MVVSGQPTCMRRHHIRPVSWGANFKIELYRSLEGNFILHQGKRWYAAETGQCQLQQYKDGPPVEPGDLLGTFAVVDGSLKFKPAPAPETAPAPPAAPS